MQAKVRWLFADQLGPHFFDDHEGDLLIIESLAHLERHPIHRAKAHLILSALHNFAAEYPGRVTYVRAHTYAEGLASFLKENHLTSADVSVCAPTSFAARSLVNRLGVQVLASRGFFTSENDFDTWAQSRGRRRLLMEDFYRNVRQRTGILMDGSEPEGGRWNYDADNRLSPPRKELTLGLPEPAFPVESKIDVGVRRELDERARAGTLKFIGRDGQRLFAATRSEALVVLGDFIAHRLAFFGPYEDAVMSDDWVMAHSLLSVPMNLGLLDPHEVVEAALDAWVAGDVPISSVEGFIRQVIGWRDYAWHLYWHMGSEYVAESNYLNAREPLPEWWTTLDADQIDAKCLKSSMADVQDRGWTHHIPRLMILGNWALQRGYEPAATAEWFTRSFIDGYPWVMAANVTGMALYADGGTMATKPYAAGGAYIRKMTNFCSGCRYRPDHRVGERACPFTAGYWWFMSRNQQILAGNARVAQPLHGLKRLTDLDELISQEEARGDGAP